MRMLFRINQILLCVFVVVAVVACSPGANLKSQYESDASLQALLKKETPTYPQVSFAVFSDLHVYPASLGTEGKAFEDYLEDDRKLLRESIEIVEAAIGQIKQEKVSFVLVPGDLTKDGERISHDAAVSYLNQLEASGKQVYVVPGNHDIKNGHSFKYIGDRTERVPNITPDDFARIYSSFGYKEAIYRDNNSLSYVAQLGDGLWLLALDSCRYADNVEGEEPITDGRFSMATMQWIEDMLARAARENKAVIAMMHHGVVEHYIGQEKNYGEYLVDDFPTVSKLLAIYNVRLVFTGHYHAQDIAVARWPEAKKFLFDVETGSLVTYPNPYRVVDINGAQKATIVSRYVKSIPSHPQDFPEYARGYLVDGIAGIATRTIQGYKVDRAEAERLAQQVARAFLAHYSGDEKLLPGQEPIQTKGLSLPGLLVVKFRNDLLVGLWQDIEPPDNNVIINLMTGNWERIR